MYDFYFQQVDHLLAKVAKMNKETMTAESIADLSYARQYLAEGLKHLYKEASNMNKDMLEMSDKLKGVLDKEKADFGVCD